MVFSKQGNEAFGKADKPDAQGSLVDDGSDGVIGLQLFTPQPQSRHQQRELLGKCRFLEFHTLVQLACGDFEHGIQFCEETGDPLLPVFYSHAFDGQADNVDGGERDVSPSDGCFGTEAVFEYACTASHGSYFVFVAFRVIGFPILTLVEGGVQVQEVGEETAGGDLACQLV